MEKTIIERTELSNRLMNIRKKERNRIIIVIVYCLAAGIVMSQFLLIGVTFWMFMAIIFIAALVIHYQKIEAEIIDKMNNLETRKVAIHT